MNRPETRHDIMLASKTDSGAIATLIALAFHPLAPSIWLIADAEQRSRIFVDYFAILVDHALATGQLYTTADHTAAALWLPVGLTGLTPPYDYDARLKAATGVWAERFRTFDAALEQRHPTAVEHYYLAILAVHPELQGQGLGSRLLTAQHEALDTLSAAAYLEASNLRTRQLYLRHGYHDIGLPLPLPGEPETLMYPMWRNRDNRNRTGLPGHR